jgi:hypothetical protein
MNSWFHKELDTLLASPLVNLRLHVTGLSSSPTSTFAPSDLEISTPSPGPENISRLDIEKPTLCPPSEVNSSVDIEKYPEQPIIMTESKSRIFEHGRPDIPALISSIVSQTNKRERIAIAACGPAHMMENIRESAARNIKKDGPGLELFLQQFGW